MTKFYAILAAIAVYTPIAIAIATPAAQIIV